MRKEMKDVSTVITDDGLKFKQALVQEKQIDYFRGDNFHELVIKNKDKILKKFKDVKAIPKLDTLEDSMRMGQMFVDFKMIVPLERHPGFPDELKKKYPKHLNVAGQSNYRMTDKGFYMWQLERSTGKLALLLTIGIAIVIAFMLFNIWPLWLKIALWYFSFYTLVFLVGLIFARFFVWLVLFHFGIDFWIFPNFFIDSNDILDSFRPMLSLEKRDDDTKMMLLRLLSAVGLIFVFFQIAQEPSNLDDLASFTGDSMHDLFEWGNDRFVMGKIADGSGKNGTARKKTAHEIFMEAIMETDEEVKPAEAPATDEAQKIDKDSEEQPDALRDDHPDYQESSTDADSDKDHDDEQEHEHEEKPKSVYEDLDHQHETKKAKKEGEKEKKAGTTTEL